MYELADLEEKTVIDFEGAPIDSPDAYWKAFGQMNRVINPNGVGR